MRKKKNRSMDGKRLRLKPQKGGARYRKLWRVVDGAVFDTLNCHPEYVSASRRAEVRSSVTKRVVGAVESFLSQDKGGRYRSG